MPPSRWFAVGSSGLEPKAGAHAIDEALVDEGAKLLVVFCSQSHDLQTVVDDVRARAPDVPLIGCTTAGEIATSGAGEANLVVAALGGHGFAVETGFATGVSSDPRSAGKRAARSLFAPRDDLPHRALLLLTDGLAGDQQEIVRGAFSVLGAGVPLVGGCAGDDLKMTKTFQIHGDQVMTDCVVAAGIASSAPLGIGVRHGWRRVGEPMLVTESGGNLVNSLDERPALDVYLEQLGLDQSASMDEQELTRRAVTHPLGLSRPDGEDQVRFIRGADFAGRSLSCMAEVPQGALVWIMEGDADSVLRATDAACADSLVPLADQAPLGVLAFDCIARRDVLGEQGMQAEFDRLAAMTGGAPVAGFYTYGEIARTHGMRGFHNQTLVVLSIA